MRGHLLSAGWVFFCILLVSCLAPSAGATVFRVKYNAPGPLHDGASWSSACLTIQAALDAAQPGDEVWVAAGGYGAGLSLPAGVGFYGGFAGTESSREERNPTLNKSIVAGDRMWYGIMVVPRDPLDAKRTTVIDGFTIRNTSPGIYSIDSVLVIAGNTIEGCEYDAVDVWGTGVAVENNVIRNSGRHGLLCQQSPDLVVRGNTISGNRGTGIVFAQSPNARITDNLVTDNDATAENSGGGVECYWESNGSLIARNTIQRNRAVGGAGIQCRNSTDVTLANNVLTYNVATEYIGGGAVRLEKTSALLVNNLIAGNHAPNGGGMRLDASSVSIRNNTIVGNGATRGGGIYATDASMLELTNNILAWNNTGLYLPAGSGSTVDFRSNCIYGNAAQDVTGLPDPVGTNGNLRADPQFATLGTNWHIQAASPCRDAGDMSAVGAGETDMDGQPRIQGPSVDMGADESDGTGYPDTRKVLRVRPEGSDAFDGLSWEKAKGTVGAALAAAGPGDEVWVAAGTYTGLISLAGGVSLYGGFAGDEAARDPRDPRAHETVLTGAVSAAGGLPGGTLDGFTIPGVSCDGASMTISRNIIRNGSGLSLKNGAHATVRDNIISGNIRADGGGIYVYDSSPVITGNTITGNAARVSTTDTYAGRGGGLMCISGHPVIANNVIADNFARTGGGLYAGGYAWPLLVNNTITGNVAETGGALVAEAWIKDHVQVVNNIIAHNSSGYYQLGSESATVFRSNWFFDNRVYDVLNVPDPVGASGNLRADPRLARTASGAWHIQPDSPCVDAGDEIAETSVDTDMDGQPRIQGARVDVGADESDGTTWPAPPAIRVRPDGHDAADGSSWAAAKATIGAALQTATESGGGEVWVAAGTYQENIAVPPFTVLYGGFQGDETGRDARDWAAHPTALDGGANGWPVVRFLDAGPFGALDGFRVRNGKASDGAGVSCYRSSPRIEHNIITGGTAVGLHDILASGGGISCVESAPVIVNNLLHGNRAASGTALILSASAPLVVNNTIAYNTSPYASTSNGAGAAVKVEPLSAPRFVNNIVAFNTAGLWSDATLTSPGNAVFGNRGFNYGGKISGVGDLIADPKFVDPDRGDFGLFRTSHSIDAGTDVLVDPGDRDLSGQPRISGAHVDLGAYEFYPGVDGITVAWVVRVLRVAGGLSAGDGADMALLDLENAGDATRHLNLADGAALLRKAMGL